MTLRAVFQGEVIMELEEECAVRPPRARRNDVIVCVDDDAAVLSALRRLLEREPYDVLTTQRPAQALEWVACRNVDLVICDQRMPEMAGTDLLQEIGRRSPGTARMILTAYPGPTSAVPELWSKAEIVVGKPWEPEALRREIRRLVGGLAPPDSAADLGD